MVIWVVISKVIWTMRSRVIYTVCPRPAALNNMEISLAERPVPARLHGDHSPDKPPNHHPPNARNHYPSRSASVPYIGIL